MDNHIMDHMWQPTYFDLQRLFDNYHVMNTDKNQALIEKSQQVLCTYPKGIPTPCSWAQGWPSRLLVTVWSQIRCDASAWNLPILVARLFACPLPPDLSDLLMIKILFYLSFASALQPAGAVRLHVKVCEMCERFLLTRITKVAFFLYCSYVNSQKG